MNWAATGQIGRAAHDGAGTIMLPVPRIALANAFLIQSRTAPVSMMLEQVIAAASDSPVAPTAR